VAITWKQVLVDTSISGQFQRKENLMIGILSEENDIGNLDFGAGRSLAFDIAEKAMEMAMKDTFTRFADLLYIRVGYCTEEYNDDNEPGLNTLVFGFLPKDLVGYSIESIRFFLSGELNRLSSREKLELRGKNVQIPITAKRNFHEKKDEIEIVKPEGMNETVDKIDLVADRWVDALENLYRESFDGSKVYWRDGAVTWE
jgi:hypothetical protein